jgi:putative membrane protein
MFRLADHIYSGEYQMKEKMNGDTYSRFNAEDLILRDELAVDRTLLANERTLLAYLRSAVALVLAGFTMIHFAADSNWFWLAGFVSIPVGLLAGIVGIVRFRAMNRIISRIRKQKSEETGEGHQEGQDP